MAFSQQGKGKHLVTSKVEHKAVLDSFGYLETKGFEVTYLDPDIGGRVSTQQVEAALREDTILVSIMHTNNELGCINPIREIGELCSSRGILFHCDAAQAVGKVAVNVDELKVDLLSISAHKFYGPKGVGCLYVRRKPQPYIEPLIHGGGHERGMRSGTLPTHQIVGMGIAADIAAKGLPSEIEKLTSLRDQLWSGLSGIDGVRLNGDPEHRVPGILNISVDGVDGETLLMAMHEVAVSSGSACNSATVAPSFVLKAIGLPDDLALASVRFSVGRFTHKEDIDYAIDHVSTAVSRLRG